MAFSHVCPFRLSFNSIAKNDIPLIEMTIASLLLGHEYLNYIVTSDMFLEYSALSFSLGFLLSLRFLKSLFKEVENTSIDDYSILSRVFLLIHLCMSFCI